MNSRPKETTDTPLITYKLNGKPTSSRIIWDTPRDVAEDTPHG